MQRKNISAHTQTVFTTEKRYLLPNRGDRQKTLSLDCAALKQEIQDCANTYIEYINDKTQYPIVMRILNTMVFKNKVPIDFIKKKIESSECIIKVSPYMLYMEFEKFLGKEMNL